MDYDKELEILFQQRKQITDKINETMLKKYKKYEEMSSEVKDDNPFSRLMALKRMGVVNNYEKITQFTCLIVGVGGVGSVVAEMLTRCGIGKLVLYDYDKVELANMNRLFFTPQQVGLTKTEAAKETLQFINPKVNIEAYNMNISSNDGYKHLTDRILHGSLSGQRVDLVLSCVDNYVARMSINTICNELDQIWLESGVSEDAMSSHIQIMVPGETACFACATPLAVVEETEGQIKREGVCAASLPTTMGVTSAFMVQNILKLLLGFGELAYCLSYNAKVDFFSNFMIKPNPDCKVSQCRQRQLEKSEYQPFLENREQLRNQGKQQNSNEGPLHAENEWGISIVQDLPNQLQSQQQDVEITQQEIQQVNLDDLMSKLSNM